LGQEEIGEDGQEGGGNGAGKDDRVVDHGDAAEDESSEAAGTNGSGDGSDANGDDGGGTDTGEDYVERERQADAEQDLRVGHSHGFGGFEDGGVDVGEADISVAKDGKKCVEDESDDGGTAADAADERDGDQETEEGEARNGLKDAGGA